MQGGEILNKSFCDWVMNSAGFHHHLLEIKAWRLKRRGSGLLLAHSQPARATAWSGRVLMSRGAADK